MPQQYRIPTVLACVVIISIVVASLALGTQRVAAELKSWQTLMAALVALAAATIAYHAAMAKVGFDRDLADQNLRRKKLGVFLRLNAALKIFAADVTSVKNRIVFSTEKRVIKAGDLYVPNAPEIEEAWNNLDLFPTEIIHDISTVRFGVRWLGEEAAALGTEAITYTFSVPRELAHIPPGIELALDAVANLQKVLPIEINSLTGSSRVIK